MIVDVNAILLVEKKNEEQIGCNHMQGDHKGIFSPRKEP